MNAEVFGVLRRTCNTMAKRTSNDLYIKLRLSNTNSTKKGMNSDTLKMIFLICRIDNI
jgi:hypothetical protein